MLKTKQKRSKIFNLVKLILFLGVIFVVYSQIQHVDDNAWQEFELRLPFSFVIAIILVLPNIWIAYLKWTITTNLIVPNASKQIKVQSFFAGLVTGMLTPNMAGNFIGRFYYFERKFRGNIILFTLLANYAQFLASMTFGWIAILIIGDLYLFLDNNLIFACISGGLVLAFVLYFLINKILAKFEKRVSFQSFNEILLDNKIYRIKILALSFLRFAIFTLQFSLMLHAFGEDLTIYAILAIWQVYLLTMLIPSIFLGKIGVRESVSLFVLTAIGMNGFAVLFTSLLIWFVNSLAPALLGFVVCKNGRHVE